MTPFSARTGSEFPTAAPSGVLATALAEEAILYGSLTGGASCGATTAAIDRQT